MAEIQKPRVYDLLILTDATMSMHAYLHALHTSLPKIIAVSALTDAFARIGVLAYRDYCGGELTEWSGWYGRDGDPNCTRDELIRFTRNLRPAYGGDWPEAAKTGFARAYSRENLSHGAFGPSSSWFQDWIHATRAMQGHSLDEKGDGKQSQVFAIVHSHLVDTLSPYIFMCHETKGSCFQIDRAQSDLISSMTMGLLLSWMGVWKRGSNSASLATLHTYKDASHAASLVDEAEKKAAPFFTQVDSEAHEKIVKDNLEKHFVNNDTLRSVITPREIPVKDFAKRYAEDESYRGLVVEQLRRIIQEDVLSVSINPVFGALWRAVCNDRTNEARDGLIQDFGASIERIVRYDDKQKMKAWLEESYNYSAEITAIIEEVPEEDRYPCVFLDPTQDWSLPTFENDGYEKTTTITAFSRDELLEIGRSCDYRILRRLGRVLTRLTYAESKKDIPAHMRDTKMEEVPMIPLALADIKYKRTFWKILLHIVVSGTKLGARPAALLAALSIRMGMKPLMAAADSEMINWSTNWNNLEIPEIWNTNCLSLILDADINFETRKACGDMALGHAQANFLSEDDRQLFERLVDYSMLKANMSTSLTAKVGWRPNKSKVPIGPLVVCGSCEFPRSVTMMAPRGICGLCATPDGDFGRGKDRKSKPEALLLNVSKDQAVLTEATWVECSVPTCRTHYIIYDTDGLRVRPKCYYCRQQSMYSECTRDLDPAPRVECVKCLNRMIWPEEYRPSDLDLSKFRCTACADGRSTIVDVETTPKALAAENGYKWLIRNSGNKIKMPLDEISLFKTITAAGVQGFVDEVEILPVSATQTLHIHGKRVHNTSEVIKSLEGWIKKRRVEAGICSLCFSNFKKRDLRTACGRSGCLQNICAGCRESWYGINTRGRLINVAALSCPFCRRIPAPKAVPSQVRFLGNLADAVKEAGSWIYAWCNDCGLAKRHMERVCANGTPAEVERWTCDECKEKGGKEVRMTIRNCPGCGTPTEKMSGCDHISCTQAGCGTHWCFSCGEKQDERGIYTHMTTEHGGFYGDAEDLGDYGADYSDDEGEW
ncbi:uncharacterized protein BCR38DRAFT_495176 [Pseudomassariella vexata]|uniref:RBR-type E3 ubiquitin transferase n=1 Tax=Pseudomassariella vexata TaxID=1141098 RepID=A0A1Y2DSC0_9PEZI|nr:uncharacterized protein BCR38DRAFT_495176 [Pseudomassariella vexata]ORY61575.1 hypothetical protein BCR38DRAFT_495176 [Pseudomassariella vexata]